MITIIFLILAILLLVSYIGYVVTVTAINNQMEEMDNDYSKRSEI